MDYNKFLTMTTVLGMLLVGGVWWWFIGVPAYQRFKDRTTLWFISIGRRRSPKGRYALSLADLERGLDAVLVLWAAVEGGVIGFMIGAIILA